MSLKAIITAVAQDLSLERHRVAAAISLLDDGNTIPFIARYRKEATEELDEAQLRRIEERLSYRRKLEDRRETVLRSMVEQDVLTPERKQAVEAADTLQRLEDLYRPFKPKRRTRATMAREKGLEPLAERILEQALEGSRESIARSFLSAEVPSIEKAYAGAQDIVAETIADHPEVREAIRTLAQRRGALRVHNYDAKEDPQDTYQMYQNFFSDARRMKPHHTLALNRAEREGVLKIVLEIPEQEAQGILARRFPTDYGSPLADDLLAARQDGYARLLFPAIEREIRSALTGRANEHAIGVFATNLRSLLLQPPLRGETVLGIDPGIRTGCKVTVVDPTGKVLATSTIYPDRDEQRAQANLLRLIQRLDVTVIAIGNGTASRETEMLVADLIRSEYLETKYTIVSEAGASVYSASPLARRELPDLNVSLRGAVSIARRLQDPLAELVKIDPKSIGVGLYQHDVNQSALGRALDVVVESVVNQVGIDLNTASPALLQYISGIGPKTAEAIVDHRDEHGAFSTRSALLDVAGIGPKTFEQAAGFLRVPNGDEPLDNTPIHPESYDVAQAVLAKMGLPLGDPQLSRRLAALRQDVDLDQLAEELGTGRPTLEDILDALARPGRDPRDALEGPVLRGDVMTMDDLREGMRLRGTVRNVVDFGAFVDIGVKRVGLIHISNLSSGYVRDPHDVISVGDVVEVEVISIDLQRGRIGLRRVE
jgi:protein Tex